MPQLSALLSHRYFNPIAVTISSLLWYFAVDVSGNYGILLWFAPLSLLIIALQSSARVTFICAFIAYFIGRSSWVPYLIKVVPIFLVPVFTLLLPLLYAFTLRAARRLVLKWDHAACILIYPAFVTAGEFVVMSFSTDGTAGSIAYTQCNYLPVIQIASITGIWGIVFITALLPSTLAVAWHLKEVKQKRMALLTGSILFFAFIGFGCIQLNTPHESTSIQAGIMVIDERLHQFTSQPDFTKEKEVAYQYVRQIKALADQGAAVVLFPEKAINVYEIQKDSMQDIFRKAAKELNVSIAGGFTVFRAKSRQNLVLFFSPDGNVQEYMKNYHVNGWEDQFERGQIVGELNGLPVPSGMAICKDMDFPKWLRKYDTKELMFVPAWDFVIDGWLHDRMAVMRAVENGYTLVRAARQGRLTVSDYTGHVLAEANCEDGAPASLLATVPLYQINTIYSSWGDWFGLLCLTGIIASYLLPGKK